MTFIPYKKIVSACFSARARSSTGANVLNLNINQQHIEQVLAVNICLPFHTANSLMHDIIFSHFSYCVTSWSQVASTITNSLMMIYN